MISKIIVLGASITSSPWFTWKDFLEIESGLPVTDLSHRGVGNEFMVSALTGLAELDSSTLVVAMMTNVDKFDWYVQGEQYHSLKDQKHPPIPVSADSGFWCTGAWFPLQKQLFQEHFYTLDYFTVKTIQQIMLIQNLCAHHGCKLQLFFDSPIWNYTDLDIGSIASGTPSESLCKPLLEQPLASKWAHYLPTPALDLDTNSLIGHCWANQLDWCNTQFGTHPPSGSHWSFYNQVMKPRLDGIVQLQSNSAMENKIKLLDKEWYKK